MLIPPEGLPETALVPALGQDWCIRSTSLAYRPVGWGSHHWEVRDSAGERWFITVDDLTARRLTGHEPLTAVYDRLRASLAAARGLRDCGLDFVVAPVPARNGEPLTRVGEGFSLALYPFAQGDSFEWGEFASPGHRLGVLRLLAAIHTAPPAASGRALADDFQVPRREELVVACDPAGAVPACGPYARAAAALIRERATAIQRLLRRYDELVREARAAGSRMVLTHGEPHPGNTMRGASGWLLLDWDTALVALPERDLWDLDPGAGSILSRYADLTGVTPQPTFLELYRLRWTITDIALEVSRFRQPHTGSLEDDQSWVVLSGAVKAVSY